jgi:hypothetical protein
MKHQEKRQSALQWWNTLTFEGKLWATIEWLRKQGKDTSLRNPNHLTGREIEEIHSMKNQ